MTYTRFGMMIVASTILMYMLMYLNTYSVDHLELSQTRFWMALLMGAAMAVLMLSFMWKMYKNVQVNIAIIAGALLIFFVSLGLVRSQATVGDVSYMKAMIPHHSIAIMTSERAHIKDAEVRRLADRIIDAQVREIAEMKGLIARLEDTPPAAAAPDLPSYRARNLAPPPPQTDAGTGVDTRSEARSSY